MIVITHPEMGVYLGGFWGLGFWSLLDSAGQDRACTFESEEQARAHVSSWDEHCDPDAYAYHDVACSGTHCATITEMVRAGIEPRLLGDMGCTDATLQ